MRRLLYAVVCAVLALSGCGGSDHGPGTPDPSGPAPDPVSLAATISPAGQVSLPASAPVTIEFSAPVNAASLQLSGTFLSLAPVLAWSAAGDVLTLQPPAGGWPRGQGGELSVRAVATSGATMDGPATARFLVPLQIASGQAAVGAIGQTDLAVSNSQATGGRSARTLLFPAGSIAVAPGGRLFVGDSSNSRILGFASIPATSDAAADLVLGQADFASGSFGTTRETLSRPQQVAIAGGRMAVTDLSNNRVLIWNTIPTASGALPDVVLGQSGFETSATACGAAGLNFPETVAMTEDGKLIVADTENNRVLVWLAVPTASGAPPDLVLGQSGPARCTGNDDDQNGVRDAAPSSRTLRRPTGLWSDGQRLVVVDSNNHRVLVWNTFPTADFQPASLVLGQSDFAHFTANDDNQDNAADAAPSARTLSFPWAGVGSNGVQLAVADSSNHRVLIWNTFPTANFQPADAVLGQADFGTGSSATAADRMNQPSGVVFYQDKILVTDKFNNRILVLRSP